MRDTVHQHATSSLIREGDRNTGKEFGILWRELLEEDYKNGGELEPTGQTLSYYYQLYRSYADHRNMPGVVLFGPEMQGVLMWGGTRESVARRWGRTATAWGVYVRPGFRDQGWEKLLQETAIEKLEAVGFNAILLSVQHGEKVPEWFDETPINSTHALVLKGS